jgi:hypothetical protein
MLPIGSAYLREVESLTAMVTVLATAPAITAAIITASVTSLVAILSAAFSVLKIRKFEREQAEDNAKIAYTYEARKRLYSVCEPLLFQAMEQAEDARLRICSLARSASNNQLRPDGSGWLDTSQVHEYYFESTVYTLLAPVTTFSILQRQLTTIDLSLDEKVRGQYEMLKLVFFSFSKDWEIAGWGGSNSKLAYDRDKTDIGEPDREKFLREAPEHYAPQGLYRGMIYLVAEALVTGASESVGGSNKTMSPERCMTFGEFQREWSKVKHERSSTARRVFDRVAHPTREPSAMAQIFDTTVELFTGFHPKSKPVLWRVLLMQYMLYRALLRGEPAVAQLSEEEIRMLDWRIDKTGPGDFRGSLAIAEEFVASEMSRLQGPSHI